MAIRTALGRTKKRPSPVPIAPSQAVAARRVREPGELDAARAAFLELERVAKLPAEQLTPEQLAERKEGLAKPLIPGLLSPEPIQERLARRERAPEEIEAAEKLAVRREPLRLRGRRSTRSRITLDAFASSLGMQKKLLGR